MDIGNTRILQFSADALIERPEVNKDIPAFHNLTGALKAFAEAPRFLTALSSRRTPDQDRNGFPWPM